MKKFLTAVFLSTVSLSAMPFSASADSITAPAPRVMLAAPAAPPFTDAERWAELARRRAAVVKEMADNSMMILFSAEPRVYTNDVDYVFRQENNLYYLTNLKQRNAALVITKNGPVVKETLFIPKRDPRAEAWTGKMYTEQDVSRISGLKTIVDGAEFEAFLESAKKRSAFSSKTGVSINPGVENLYLLLPEDGNDDGIMREYRHEYEWVKDVAKINTDKDSGEIS